MDEKPFAELYSLEKGREVFHTFTEWSDIILTPRTIHRVDGPAIWFSRGDVIQYCLNGVEYTQEEHTNLINKYKQLPRSVRLTHSLRWVRGL